MGTQHVLKCGKLSVFFWNLSLFAPVAPEEAERGVMDTGAENEVLFRVARKTPEAHSSSSGY